uniref:Protein CCSMST1 n=1 Tax=Moschus moschiferus TaxID=68415 RepID=A0A8C6DGA4_MOSMO
MSGVLCAPAAGPLRVLRLERWASRSPPLPPSSRAPAQLAAEGDNEDDPHRPLRFSSSSAAPRRWTVKQSLGTGQQRPWWVVLPLSLSLTALVIRCFFRQEIGVDRWLKRMLLEEVPEPSDTSEEPGAPVAHGVRT